MGTGASLILSATIATDSKRHPPNKQCTGFYSRSGNTLRFPHGTTMQSQIARELLLRSGAETVTKN